MASALQLLFCMAALVIAILISLTSAMAAPIDGAGSSAIDRLRELKMRNQTSQREAQLRQEFFDRVIFQIDTHYKAGSLNDFLSDTFKKMAELQPESPMYDFLLQAAELMRHRQEKHENPIDVLNRYIDAGGILNPLPASRFLATQSYSNGERSEYVTGVDREKLGEFVDKDMQILPASAAPILKTVEIRE